MNVRGKDDPYLKIGDNLFNTAAPEGESDYVGFGDRILAGARDVLGIIG